MSSVLKFIEGYMTGDAWEELCASCYRLRYQSDHYTRVPAVHGGDAGIEGFTLGGVVHQCYCPEREYSDDDLYSHQRDKLTADIDKLLQNGNRLRQLGVPPIREWHFNIPEYRDARIISHARAKQEEVILAKAKNPSSFTHIADDFRIVIKTADDFAPEIGRTFRTNITDMKLNLAIQHSDALDWSKCDSQKVANIRRKIKAVMHVDEKDPDFNELVNIYINFYISGMEIMNRLQCSFPEIYEDLYKLEQSYKREVFSKTRMNTDRAMNQSLFNNILNDFQENLEKDFSKMLTQASIFELKHDLVASWLADCSMEFRGE